MRKSIFIIVIYFILQTVIGFAAYLFVQLSGASQASPTHSLPAGVLLASLLVSSLLTAIAAILICGKGFRTPFRGLKQRANTTATLLLCLLTSLPLILASNCLVEIADLPDIMGASFSEMSVGFWALPVMAVIGPLSEEICFRYGVTGALLEQMPGSPAKVIVFSALIFGVIHMNPAQSLSAFLLGLYLAWLYVKTRSIWPSVVCHVCNNLIAVLMLRFLPQDATLTSLLPIPYYIYIVLAAAVVVAIPLLLVLNKRLTP
jgi:uncharacterized protein